jgi:hypothetical protein
MDSEHVGKHRIVSGATLVRGWGGLLSFLAAGVLLGSMIFAGAQARSPLSAGATNATEPPAATEALPPPGEVQALPLASTRERLHELIDNAANQPRFDGTLLGWRVAPNEVLEKAGLRNWSLDCEQSQAGEEKRTQLDFSLGYLPRDVEVTLVTGPIKWVCGDVGVSVLWVYNLDTPYGPGQVWLERSIQDQRAIEMDVARDSVEVSQVNGHDAILFHPYDDATGFGTGRIVVLEGEVELGDQILSVYSDVGVAFADLVRIAEGVK